MVKREKPPSGNVICKNCGAVQRAGKALCDYCKKHQDFRDDAIPVCQPLPVHLRR